MWGKRIAINTNWTEETNQEQGSAIEADVRQVWSENKTGEEHRNTGGQQNTGNTGEVETDKTMTVCWIFLRLETARVALFPVFMLS